MACEENFIFMEKYILQILYKFIFYLYLFFFNVFRIKLIIERKKLLVHNSLVGSVVEP